MEPSVMIDAILDHHRAWIKLQNLDERLSRLAWRVGLLRRVWRTFLLSVLLFSVRHDVIPP